MNKIGTRFIILLISSVIIISITLTYISIGYGKTLILDASKKGILDELGRFTESINTEFSSKETYVKGLEAIILSTFDMQEFNSNPNYLTQYEQEILPIMKEYSMQTKNAYVFFNPAELGQTMDIWFFDRDKDGQIERIPQVTSEYYMDSKGKEWFFRPVETKKEYWTDSYQGTILPEYHKFVSYTRPVIVDGRAIAVVGSDFEYTFFEEDILKYHIYDTGYAFLLNQDQQIIVHPLKDQYKSILEIGVGKYKWMYNKMNEESLGIIEYKWVDGNDKLLAYSRLKNHWIIGLSINTSEIYNGIRYHAIKITLISMCLMIVISIIGYHSSKKITKPLEGIVNQVKNIANGDYNSNISLELISDVTEIGTLSDVVEAMRKNLKKSFELIKEHNEELDQKVEQRTEELNEANKELKESIKILRKTQKELLISEKQKSIAYIIIEIAHRLNTPIGNALTLITFIENLNKKLYREIENEKPSIFNIKTILSQFDKATVSAVENIKKASSIIGSLKEFSLNDQYNMTSKIRLPEFLTKNILQDKSIILDNVSVSVKMNGKEVIEFYSNAYLIFKIFACMFSFSSFFSNKFKEERLIDIVFEQSEEYVNIDYIDKGFVVDQEFQEKVFEPFAFTSFNTGSHGIELYLAYNIITQGLGGNISYHHNKDNILHLKIELPKENGKKTYTDI